MSHSVLLLSDVGEGPSLERSWEILIASSIAANNPSPPSPRRAGPKHSGRRISSLTTTLAFSSTLSPEHRGAEVFTAPCCAYLSKLKITDLTGNVVHWEKRGFVNWDGSNFHHCRKPQSAGSRGSVHPPQDSSRCRGTRYAPASHSSAAHTRPGTAPPVTRWKGKCFSASQIYLFSQLHIDTDWCATVSKQYKINIYRLIYYANTLIGV